MAATGGLTIPHRKERTMVTTPTTQEAAIWRQLAQYYEKSRFFIDDRGVPMIQDLDSQGAIIGTLAVGTMRDLYRWMSTTKQAEIRTILGTLGYAVPAAASDALQASPVDDSSGYDFTIQSGFRRFGDVHDWFTDMRFAFKNLSDEGLLDELDPVLDDEREDQPTCEEEVDSCADDEQEYDRAVQRNVPPVLDELRAMSHDLQEAIAFLEVRRTVARARLAAAEPS
jgi:hypothetical protein